MTKKVEKNKTHLYDYYLTDFKDLSSKVQKK